ncbi:MAG: T9SS type A sorting domain-containing protein [Bacteroidota bacterium]
MTKLYSLLLLAVAFAPIASFAPIAYGQPTAMQIATGHDSDVPHAPVYQSTSAEVLLDQLSDFDGQWISFRSTPESTSDATSADDFVVPDGVMWTIQEVFIDGNYLEFPQPHPDGAAACLAADLGFWSDAAGEPGDALFFYEGVTPLSDDEGDLTFMVDDTTLEPGTYWLSLQCSGTLTFENDEGPRGYYWERNDAADPGTLGSPALSINPAGGLEYPAEGWNPLTAFDFNEAGYDFSFALSGTSQPATSDEGNRPTAQEARLSAYPNPARSSVSVTIALEAPGTVVLDVYDALGRRIASEPAQVLPAGEHTVPLDLRSVPPGFYVVRTQGAVAASRRITVVR